MPMSLQEQIRLLSMVDIFGPLSQEEMKDLANRCPDTFLEQGDVLYAPQDGAERLFILKQGRVQVYEVIRGGEEITLSVVEGGSVFGEIALTGQSLEGVYVRALAPTTVVSLRREDLEGLIMKSLKWDLGSCASSPRGCMTPRSATPTSSARTSLLALLP